MNEPVEHYYIKNPKCKKVEQTIKENVLGFMIVFKTCSGMYSPKRIDSGSLVHLKFMRIKNNDKVLDLGCGYGTVGILVKKLYPKSTVIMSELNTRAVEYAKKNVKANKVTAEVIQSDGFENIKDKNFDVILFNPPINAGLSVCYKLIAGAFAHLNIGGTLQIVLRPKEGYRRILKKITSIFGNTSKIGKDDIYDVYLAKKEKNIPVSKYDQIMFKK